MTKSIFDPEFNGLPGISNYRGDVDPELGGKDYKPPIWSNWPLEELLIYCPRVAAELMGVAVSEIYGT